MGTPIPTVDHQQPDQLFSNQYHPAGAPSREELELNPDYVDGKWTTEKMAASLVGADTRNTGLTANSQSSTSSLSEEIKKSEEIGRIENTLINFKCSKFFAEMELELVDWYNSKFALCFILNLPHLCASFANSSGLEARVTDRRRP